MPDLVNLEDDVRRMTVLGVLAELAEELEIVKLCIMEVQREPTAEDLPGIRRRLAAMVAYIDSAGRS